MADKVPGNSDGMVNFGNHSRTDPNVVVSPCVVALFFIHGFQGTGRLQPSGSAVYGNCDIFHFRGTGLGEPGAAGVSWDDSDRSYSGNCKGLGARGFQPDHLHWVVDAVRYAGAARISDSGRGRSADRKCRIHHCASYHKEEEGTVCAIPYGWTID